MAKSQYESPEMQFEVVDPVTGQLVPMYIDPAQPSWSGSFYALRSNTRSGDGGGYGYGDEQYYRDYDSN